MQTKPSHLAAGCSRCRQPHATTLFACSTQSGAAKHFCTNLRHSDSRAPTTVQAASRADTLGLSCTRLAAHHARQYRGLVPAVASILLWQRGRTQGPVSSPELSCTATSEATISPETSTDPLDDQPDDTQDELPTSNVAEIASIQTPASVWLPSRRAAGHQNKVTTKQLHLDFLLQRGGGRTLMVMFQC